ncbi:class I SAM-dependent methyltransferase [Phnomibacter sp. MR]|uniref:class I SAM-dependent methyltransferase n=1 Tax=Phnomibacter sp. MR TaxID=3042318 RepID=UPI003A801B8D
MNIKSIRVTTDFNPGISHPLYLTRRVLLESLESHAVSLNGKLLDFGCGAKPYQSLFSVDQYIGVDFQGEGHDHSNEQIDVYYDGKTLPFDNESFDSIFSTEVFEHVFNLSEMLKELNRVLKPGGQMLITCPFAICEHEQPNDFARYTSFAIRHLLQEHGFEVVHQEKLGTAVQALWQMRITYWNLHVLFKLRNIPVVRSGTRLVFNTVMNVFAIITNALLPTANDLYLNNLVLARKKRES